MPWQRCGQKSPSAGSHDLRRWGRTCFRGPDRWVWLGSVRPLATKACYPCSISCCCLAHADIDGQDVGQRRNRLALAREMSIEETDNPVVIGRAALFEDVVMGRIGHDPEFLAASAALVQSLQVRGWSVRVVAAGDQQDRCRSKLSHVFDGSELIHAEFQTPLRDPNGSIPKSLEPGGIALNAAGKGRVDVVVEAFEDHGVEAAAVLRRVTDGGRPHGNAEGSPRFIRPTFSDQIHDSSNVSALVVSEARPAPAALAVCSVIEGHASIARCYQKPETLEGLSAIVADAVKECHGPLGLRWTDDPANQSLVVGRATKQRFPDKAKIARGMARLAW